MNELTPPEDKHHATSQTFGQLVPDFRYTITSSHGGAEAVVADVFVLDTDTAVVINSNAELRFSTATECWYVNSDALAGVYSSDSLTIEAASISNRGAYTLVRGVSGGPGFYPLFTCTVDAGTPWSVPVGNKGTSTWFKFAPPRGGPDLGLELNVVTGGDSFSFSINGVQWYVNSAAHTGAIGGSEFNGSTWLPGSPADNGWVAKTSLWIPGTLPMR